MFGNVAPLAAGSLALTILLHSSRFGARPKYFSRSPRPSPVTKQVADETNAIN